MKSNHKTTIRCIAIALLLFCGGVMKSQPVRRSTAELMHETALTAGMKMSGSNGGPAKPIGREKFRRGRRG